MPTIYRLNEKAFLQARGELWEHHKLGTDITAAIVKEYLRDAEFQLENNQTFDGAEFEIKGNESKSGNPIVINLTADCVDAVVVDEEVTTTCQHIYNEQDSTHGVAIKCSSVAAGTMIRSNNKILLLTMEIGNEFNTRTFTCYNFTDSCNDTVTLFEDDLVTVYKAIELVL